jgi:hypothetical protein
VSSTQKKKKFLMTATQENVVAIFLGYPLPRKSYAWGIYGPQYLNIA